MIRPAAAADLPALAVLWHAYRAETDDRRALDETAWRRWILPRISAGDARVGLIDRRVAAYVVWQRGPAGPDGTRDLIIPELYVHPDGRGQRLGSGLLARAIDCARQRGCDSAQLTSNVRDERVHKLAAPFGFRLDGDALVLALRQAVS